MIITDSKLVNEYYESILLILNDSVIKLSSKKWKLRRLYSKIFSDILASEIQSFPNSLSRIEFVVDKYEIEEKLAKSIRKLYFKLRKQVNFDASAEHGKKVVDSFAYKISAIIAILSGIEVPRELADLLTLQFTENIEEEIISSSVEASVKTYIARIRGIVNKIGAIQTGHTGVEYCDIRFQDEESTSGFTLRVWKGAVDETGLFTAKPLLKPQSVLNLFNIIKPEKLENFYSTSAQSLIVFEPDYLIDASELAECFQSAGSNHKLALLSKFMSRETNAAMFKGNLVNSLLDSILQDPNADYDETIEKLINRSIIPSIILGEETVSNVKSVIKEEHLQNIRRLSSWIEKNNLNARLEPTFLSSDFGLYGRLDLLHDYPKEPGRKDIVELKSGKEPNYDVWANHRMQVVCYEMLLRSTMGESRKGNNSIFYSKAQKDILRNIPITNQLEKSLILTRNSIVAMLYNLAGGDFSVLNEFDLKNFGIRAKFDDAKITKFENVIRNSDSLERSYFKYFLQFVINELKTAKVGGGSEEEGKNHGFASLWCTPLDEKFEYYAIISELQYQQSASNAELLVFTRKNAAITTLREGDIILLYPYEGDETDPLKHQLIKGAIKTLNNEEVIVEPRCKFLNEDFFSRFNSWIVEPDFFEPNFKPLFESLFIFLQASKEKKNLLLGLKEPSACAIEIDLAEKYPRLSPSHLENLKKAIEAEDYFLLQGPPGTGKTSSFLISLTDYLTKVQNKTVVLTAFTNRAVIEICTNLAKNGLPYILISGSHDEDLNTLSNLMNDRNVADFKEVLDERQIFVATVSSFLNRNHEIMALRSIDIMIVDEASQLLEPSLIGLLTKFEKFILIGDQNQLPCVTIQNEKLCRTNSQELNSIGIRDLGNSIFERLINRTIEMKWQQAYGMLTTHFRMHEDIAGLINHFYDNKLMVSEGYQSAPLLPPIQNEEEKLITLLGESRIIFIESKREDKIKCHDQEAETTVKLLMAIKKIYGENFNSSSVGVITPWRAQISMIRNKIDDKKLYDTVLVDTVERFQGSEKDIIILSTAVSSNSFLKNIQSLNSTGTVDRKLNVAISRAKNTFIMLGNSYLLSQSPIYAELILKIKKRYKFVSA